MIEKTTNFFLRYRWMVVLAVVAVCAGGFYSLSRLSVDAFPDISPNLVQVFAELEGMAPEEVEQFVTRPIEVAMRGIPGVEKIRSISSLGLSTVNIYFEEDVDVFLARQLVAERLREAEESIPENIDMPHGLEMGAIASGMGKILAYYLEGGEYTTTELRTLQDWVVKRDIQTLPGIAKVISQGGHVRQYEIRVDPDMLRHYGLAMDELIEAVRMNNANMGAGIIERGSEELVVRTIGLIETVEDIESIVIRSEEGTPVLVRDVASVEFGEAFRRGVAIMDGDREIVTGSVYKMYGANSFEVIGRLKERLAQIEETLPEGVSLVTYYDQSSLVRNSVNTVRNALVAGLILVVLVSFVFLGDLRNAFIVLCSLPFSTLFAFIAMQRAGMPGDLISFGGIAIALGMIVDATIIMVEKIQSSVDEGHEGETLLSVITRSAMEVGRPIFFATVIIVIVFLPIFTLGEVEGKMFRPLAFAVSSTMLGALLYSLVAAPVFYRLVHRDRIRRGRGRAVPARVMGGYRSVLLYFLRRRALVITALVVLVAAGASVFFSLGREFVPTLQEGTVQVLAYMNPNISLHEITSMTRRICSEMDAIPEVDRVIADIGYGEVGPHMHHTNYACITVSLLPKREWKTVGSQEELVSLIDSKLEDYPGMAVSFSQPVKHEIDGLVGGAGTAVVAKIFGHDMKTLKALAEEVSEVVSHVAGAADLRVEQVDGQTQLQVDLDDVQLSRHGLSDQAVEATVSSAIGGVEAGKVFEGDRAFGINVRYAGERRDSVEDISGLLVRAPGGYDVPLRELADIRTVTGLRQISREETRRFISVQCNVRGRDEGGFVEEARKAVKAGVEMPPGYRVDWGGQFELQQAADRRLALIIPLTLFLVLLMIYGLFNSFKSVFLIMLNIPLAMVGGVFALWLFGENVSIPSSIGFIALFGIALTDGLVLISRFNHLRDRGMGLRETVLAGCESKFRPVLMTTITTALGLLPLILSSGTGSEVQRPLAIVVIGGLISSTALTLIVLPTLYEWMTLKTETDGQ